MTRNIVAIGGGSIGDGGTRAIDEELVRLTNQARPHLLFIPTASNDDTPYAQMVERVYRELGCTTDTLWLWGKDAENPEAKIAQADAIYVGGGNTKAMMRRWRELGVDRALREFVASGKPAGGLSAGALCWFRVGNSDWPQYEGLAGINTAPIECLGIVDLVLCPHTRDEGFRLKEFREMMQTTPGVGIGLDDGCAIQIRDDEYRILASQEGSVAHRIEWVEGQLAERILGPHADFRALGGI
ncbi:MAG: Type 1 glutamine amidotransferase-like domain-containing protein [Fimbriimonas sp.]